MGWALILTTAVSGSALASYLVRSQSQFDPAPLEGVSWYPSRERYPASDELWLKFVQDSHTDLESRDPQILVVGDSITYLTLAFHRDIWNEYYGEGKTLNLGIPGDCTHHVLWRLTRYPLTSLDPEIAVVLLGVNNLAEHSPAEAAAGVAQVVKLIRRQLPETEVLLVGLLPVGSELESVSRKARETNRLLESWASQRGVAYANLAEHFRSPDGRIHRELYTDAVHLSEEGIRAWAEALRPVLRRLLPSQQSIIVGAAPGPSIGQEPRMRVQKRRDPKEGSGAGSGT